MMHIIRTHLSLKIFLSYLLVILVGGIILALSISLFLPGAFNRHMAEMMVGERGMRGMMAGDHGMSSLYQGFRDGVYDALLLAVLATSVAAVGASALITRRLIAPLRDLSQASQRIASGSYTERVKASVADIRNMDELDRLAQDFNRMAESLEQTEALHRQLIGDVSHELRTPLAAIKGSMEGLIDGVLTADIETFEQIHRETDRLQRLVDDLQELSRVEAGTFELNLQPVALADLVETVTNRLAQQYAEKGVILESDIPADLHAVQADADRLNQVLLNLIGNALQYTPAGGQVKVFARQRGEVVQVCVQDSGVGIAAEHLSHVFDRFYRVDRSRARLSGGSGIGLTIAKWLVEAQGGSIWAESEGEGMGSTFIFTLPVAS